MIKETTHCEEEFISTISIRPKKDGTYRLILKLKNLNDHVEYHHFKMDTLQSAIWLMKQNCYMASVYLQDAYYSVPIDEEYQKFLRFSWRGQLFQFTCLPNGLSCAPRLHTKILKPVYATIRKEGHLNVGYTDDSYLQGDTIHECLTNITDTCCLFKELGFIKQPVKSVLRPVQNILFVHQRQRLMLPCILTPQARVGVQSSVGKKQEADGLKLNQKITLSRTHGCIPWFENLLS